MNIISLIDGTYKVWNGDFGYDTRPYAIIKDEDGSICVPLPVACHHGFANNYVEDYHVEAGDLKGFVGSLPVGTRIVIPEYSGYQFCSEKIYLLTEEEGWELEEDEEDFVDDEEGGKWEGIAEDFERNGKYTR